MRRLLLACLTLSSLAAAEVPGVIAHAGRLLDSSGKGLTGTYEVTFLISETGDANLSDPKWTETRQIQMQDGLYGVVLGDSRPGAGGTPFPPSLLEKSELFLSVKIADKELLPRQRLSSAIYALRAGRSATTESVLADGVVTSSLKDASVTDAKLALNAVTKEKIADGAVGLAELDLAGGKFVGLDADKLDGLDSSAFAPASIEQKIGTPPEGSSVAGELAAVKTLATSSASAFDAMAQELATIKARVGTPVGASVSADLGAVAADVSTLKSRLGTPAGASLSADVGSVTTEVGAIKTRLGAPAGASLSADVGAVTGEVATIKSRLGTPSAASLSADLAALSTQIAAMKAVVDGGAKLNEYSVGCQDFAAKGWKNEFECLHDGRWHMYFRLNASGRTESGGTATRVGFFEAARAGADTKVRVGIDWYLIQVRHSDNVNDGFWCFFSEYSQFTLSFYVRPTTIDNVHAHQVRDTYWSFHTAWLNDGNRHYAQNYYESKGAMNLNNVPSGVEFWAKY